MDSVLPPPDGDRREPLETPLGPNGDRRGPLEARAGRADTSAVSTPTTDEDTAPTSTNEEPHGEETPGEETPGEETHGEETHGDGTTPGGPSELTTAMHQLLDLVVGPVPGVVGAVVSSADGFVLAARMPATSTADAASLAAMSAALLGLSNRLVQAVAPGPSRVAELRSEGAHAYVFAVAHAATLTVLATPESERPQVMAVGREVTIGLVHLLRGAVDV